MRTEITITATMTPDEAWAIAQMLKRGGFMDYRHLCESRDHTHEAVNAAEKLRDALAEAGVSPR